MLCLQGGKKCLRKGCSGGPTYLTQGVAAAGRAQGKIRIEVTREGSGYLACDVLVAPLPNSC